MTSSDTVNHRHDIGKSLEYQGFMQVTVSSENAPFYTSPNAPAEAGEGKIKGKTGVQVDFVYGIPELL